ncbi:hypothetical protein [Paenibacillus sp. HJGM_3]|uniref:hypothetical protein n=1 Tax=Paenibacillus sp. HJGM_3 TaxID=3379816 RepID=UPI00385CB8EF
MRDWRKWVTALAVLAGIVSILGFGGKPALACSPKPWSFAEVSQGAVAAVQGVADKVSPDGRQATLEVSAYAGPDKAPKTVMLPATVDSREGGGSGAGDCPDFSVQFQPGQAYVVLLAELPPAMRLAYPQWVTAFPVLDGQLVTGMRETDRAPVAEQLSQFAQAKGTAVQYPTQLSPVWYPPGGRSGFAVVWVGLAVVIAGGGIALWLRAQRRREVT